MWTKRLINNSIYLVRESDEFRVSVLDSADEHPLYQEYLQWVADGNEAEDLTNGN